MTTPLAAAASPATGATPPSSPESTSGGPEWEELPLVVQHDEVREYKSDSDVQAMIEQLANQIADGDRSGSGTSIRPRPSATGPTGSSTSPASAGPSGSKSGPASTPAKLPSRAEAKRAKLDASAAAPAPAPTPARAPAPAPAPAVAAAAPSPAARASTSAAPAAAEPAAVTPPTVAPADVQPTAAELSRTPRLSAPAPAPGPVEVPTIVEAAPALPSSGEVPTIAAPDPKRVVDRISGSSEHKVIVARPAVPPLSAPQLVPKIEAKPGAPRPTKPVDFHALLKDSGLAAGTPKPKRRKRHPFRAMFKLVLVIGILGGAGWYAKVRFLDTKWQGDLEEIASAVAERRGLEWERAVDVVQLPPDQYALRLATAMTGIDSAETTAVAAEWRAMGLSEGNIDLVAMGTAATADQPAFYDPADEKIYELEGLSPELHEIALSRAMTNALTDQHMHWGDRLVSKDGVEASASVRLGVRALFDGDALAIRAETTEAVLADTATAAEVTEELAGLRLGAAPVARGASPYGVALSSQAGTAARWLFTTELTPDTLRRNGIEQISVESDAAIFDGARGRTAPVDNPPNAEEPQPAPTTTDAPAATTPPPPTVSAPTTAASAAATPTTLATQAGFGATSRGMIYWYYVLAGRLDSEVAWDAALRWQGDGTWISSTPAARCVDAVLVTKDVADRDVLLSALEAWAAEGPEQSAARASAMNDTAIAVHSCDPGPSADTFSNEQIPPFGRAAAELLIANEVQAAGLPRTEVARTCVIQAIRASAGPALLQSSSVDRSLTEPSVNDKSAEVGELIEACATK